MPGELWTEVCNIVKEVVTKTISKKRKCKKAKLLSEEASQIARKEEMLKARRKEKRYPFEFRVPKNSKKR